jgi:DNA gyrase subunit A
LTERFNFSEKQCQAILEMRLRRLTGLERDKINDEYNELMKQVEYLKSILDKESVIKFSLIEVKQVFRC